jgi:hypothetical protein
MLICVGLPLYLKKWEATLKTFNELENVILKEFEFVTCAC